MATKTFYATKGMRDPTYRTRMLKAGDPVELDGPKGRFYSAIGAVSVTKPRIPRAALTEATPTPEAQPQAPKPRRRRKAAKK